MKKCLKLLNEFSVISIVLLSTGCGLGMNRTLESTSSAATSGGSGGSSGSSGGTSAFGPLAPLTQVSAVAGQGYPVDRFSKEGIGTSARITGPIGIVANGTDLYITTYGAIQKFSSTTASLTNFVGSYGVSSVVDGPATSARFAFPSALASDGTYLYAVDRSRSIRRVTIATGVTATIAGDPNTSGYIDAIGTAARFDSITGMTYSASALYVTDSGRLIRKIDLVSGAVTTIAGNMTYGHTNGIGTAATFSYPKGIAAVGSDLYISEGCEIRKTDLTTNTVTTLAGDPNFCGEVDGVGSASRFIFNGVMTTDGTYLYVTDINALRKVDIATETVTTVAGFWNMAGEADGIGADALFNGPQGMAMVGGFVYITDGNTIRKFDPATSSVSTFIGSSVESVSGFRDGVGAGVRFSGTVYGSGSNSMVSPDGNNLYMVDGYASVIRRLDLSTGAVSLFAGSPGKSGSADGIGSSARFYFPRSIVTDGTNLYVTETGNYTIRKIVISTGAVTTLAGSAGMYGLTDASGSSARFRNPVGITTDGPNLYVTDDIYVRKIVIASGAVTTIAGDGTQGTNDGVGLSAQFYSSHALTYLNGNLFIVDQHAVRKMDLTSGAVTTFAGNILTSGGSAGTGTAARFDTPYAITTDGTDLYVCGLFNGLWKINPSSAVVTGYWGSGGALFEGTLETTSPGTTFGIAAYGTALYQFGFYYGFAIRKIEIPTGSVSFNAGSVGYDWKGYVDGAGASAKFNSVSGLAADSNYVYAVDSGNSVIRKLSLNTGVVSTLAGAPISGTADGAGTAARFNRPAGIARVGTDLYVTDSSGTIRKVDSGTGVVTTFAGDPLSLGDSDGIGTAANFQSWLGMIVTDGTFLYFADANNCKIRKIEIATAQSSTVAGNSGSCTTLDGVGGAAEFEYPYALAIHGTNLFVSDGAVMRKIDLQTGVVTSVAGTYDVYGGQDGTGPGVSFGWVSAMESDGVDIYFADGGVNAIRKMNPTTFAVTTVFSGSAGASYGALNSSTTKVYGLTGLAITPQGLAIGTDSDVILFH